MKKGIKDVRKTTLKNGKLFARMAHGQQAIGIMWEADLDKIR